MTALEADLAAYQRDHRQEHEHLAHEARARHSQITSEMHALREKTNKAIGDLYETLGGVAKDLGAKANMIQAQAANLEIQTAKIRVQGGFLSKLGLLVVFGAALGGGIFQGAVWYFARH